MGYNLTMKFIKRYSISKNLECLEFIKQYN